MSPPFDIGTVFQDFTLPDQDSRPTTLHSLSAPSTVDKHTGLFPTGYPVILLLFRGFFCPRDQAYFRSLTEHRASFLNAFARMAALSIWPPTVNAAFRAGLGCDFITFLSDEKRDVIGSLGLVDETEGEYADVARPYIFILKPTTNNQLIIHKAYDGWWYVSRPTPSELLQDLRDAMASLKGFSYDDWNTPDVRLVRIPAKVGFRPLGQSGKPVHEGVVEWFNASGFGSIRAKLRRNRRNSEKGSVGAEQSIPDVTLIKGEEEEEEVEESIFFSYSALPGEGNRVVNPGVKVKFELVKNFRGNYIGNNVQIQA